MRVLEVLGPSTGGIRRHVALLAKLLASGGDEVVAHPVVRRLAAGAGEMPRSGHDWICATPFVLDVAARLAAARRTMAAAP